MIHPGLKVTSGTVGSIHISFSLLKLTSKPIVILVNDVHLFVQDIPNESITHEFIQNVVQKKFEEKLKLAYEAQLLYEQELESVKELEKKKNML